jgi:hypothetical protein
MRKLRRLVPSLAIAIVLISLSLWTQKAFAQAAEATGKYCYTVVEKIHPPEPDTRIVSTVCSSRHAPGSVLPDTVSPDGAIPAGDTLLVIFFQDAGFGGAWDAISGSDGPCDNAGYGLRDLRQINDSSADSNPGVGGISSYQLYNNCDQSDYFQQPNFSRFCEIDVIGTNIGYVGDACNDNLRSMKIRT